MTEAIFTWLRGVHLGKQALGLREGGIVAGVSPPTTQSRWQDTAARTGTSAGPILLEEVSSMMR